MSHSEELGPLFLKRCPLCGALNTVSISECASCGWRGHFDSSAAELRDALHRIYAEPRQADTSAIYDWLRRNLKG